MKKKLLFSSSIKLLLLLFSFLIPSISYSQCTIEKGNLDFPFTINGVTVTGSGTGGYTTYPNAYTSCGVSTKANSVFIGQTASTYTNNFSAPVNDMIYNVTAAGDGEVVTITVNSGTPTISYIGGTCSSAMIITGNVFRMNTGTNNHGGRIKISSTSPYTSVTFSHNGAAGGLLMTMCFDGVASAIANSQITSLSSSNVAATSATLSANVVSDGGAAITSRGFYYGTSPNPTTNLTTVSGTTGVMSANISGLQPNTQYYYKAFSVNSNGTTTTSDGTFTTTAITSILNISSSLTSFSTCTSAASAEQSFTVSGTSLAGNATVTAPTGYQISLTSGSGFASSVSITASGTLSATTVYVRLASNPTSGTKSGNITIASTGATTQNVAVTGTVNTGAQLTVQNSLCASQGLFWSTWSNVTSTTATGTIGNVGVTVTHSAGGLSTTPSMYNYSTFPAQYAVPNGTTLRNDKAGTFTFTFDRPVTNPQVAFSSIGNQSTPVGLTTSVPYQVIWNGQAMTYSTSTTMTGAEGFTIVRFPGTHTSITIQYDRDESYANVAFGAENFNCSAPTVCEGQPITLTAGGGASYQWSPSTGLSATNTAQVIATPTTTTTYTVIDPTNPCAIPVSVTINVNPVPAAPIASATQLICLGSKVATLQAAALTGQTLAWYTVPTGGTALASTTALVPGTTYYAEAVNSTGCASTRIAVMAVTNNALSFDGGSNFVSVGDNIENLGDVTMESWVYWKGSNLSHSEIFTKDLISAFAITGSNKLHANFGDGTSWIAGLDSQGSIPLNVWTHVAVTRQNGVVKMFINGVEDSATLNNNATGQNSVIRVIGGKMYNGSTANTIFSGMIDELRFWSVAKTSAEIASNMTTNLVGNETDLLAYYNFNQGIANGNNTTVTSLNDLTPNANNGVINNFALNGSTSNFVPGYFPQITGVNTINAGSTTQLSHPVSSGTWSSASTGIATVNSSGLVRGVSGGTSVITYTYCGSSTTFTVTVNALPTISTISNQILCANVAAAPVRFVIADLETPAANLVLNVTSSNTNLLPLSNISFSGNTGARTMNYTTVAGIYGTSTVTLTVTDADGNVATQTFNVQVAPDRITTSAGVPSLQSNTPAVVDGQITVNNPGNVDGALVIISSGFVPGDVLSHNGALPTGVTRSYNSSTGVLTFTGSLTSGELQTILREVKFSSTSNNSQNRTFTFNLGSALPFSANNHFYQFITAPGISWTAAKAAAEQLSFFGKQGYLTTVTSAAENQFIVAKIQGQGWMGASDEQTEGVWKWMTGPEAGTQFWQGRSNGNVVSGLYNNWASGEPNDYGSGEDYAHFLTNGQWNDYPLTLGGIQGYVVEFGGMANDPCVLTSATKTVEVVVNVAPTDISLNTNSINENNVANAVVGSLTTTDADAGDTFTYTLVSGAGATDNTSFTLTGNQLKATQVFDFETKNSYSIRVRTTDAGGLLFEKTFTITVNNVNETPTNVALSANTINENNAIGAVVGNLTTTDADAGDTFTYTLVSGTGSTDNASFTITGGQLKATPVFDFETKNSYSVRVRTTDAGGLTFEKVFVIAINDINEAPTNITLSANSINENNALGLTIGNLTSTDVDAGDTFTYTLVSGTGATDNASFTIAGNQLKAAATFDFEAKNSYSVRVRTTDARGLSFEKVFIININDVNEAPTNIALSNANLFEGNAVGANIGLLTSTDPDAGSTFTYSLVSGDVTAFNIAGNTLRASNSFNFSNKSSYAVRIKTTDAGGLSFEKDFTITISQVPVIIGTGNQVGTNIPMPGSNNPEISKGLTSQFTVIGSGYTNYSWSPSTGLSNSSIPNPIAKPLQTTTYTLTVTNAFGNRTSVTITVVVNDDYFVIPNNILTPNGDGQNDTWVVGNIANYPNNEVKIFDRTGRLVYTKKGYNNEWNAPGLNQGVFYYIISFGNNTAIKKGAITLIR